MTPADRIEIYVDDKNEYRWRVKGRNNETLASGEGYVHEQDCENMARSLFPDTLVVLLPNDHPHRKETP